MKGVIISKKCVFIGWDNTTHRNGRRQYNGRISFSGCLKNQKNWFLFQAAHKKTADFKSLPFSLTQLKITQTNPF
ncbi:MAG: hypothetical protein J5680_05390 [Neisseriaceae bacterium]|nr:hypothetical protein [Neisseriaceae bacterium]